MKNALIYASLACLSLGTPAFAQNLTLDPGYWEMSMTLDMPGNSMVEKTGSCTTDEDLSMSAQEFIDSTVADFNCSTGPIEQVENLYKSKLTCDPSTFMTEGDVTIVSTPRAMMVMLEIGSIVEEMGPIKMYLITNRVGECED